MLINYLYVDIQLRFIINKDENDGYPKRARVPAKERERKRRGGEQGALDKKAGKISDAPDWQAAS